MSLEVYRFDTECWTIVLFCRKIQTLQFQLFSFFLFDSFLCKTVLSSNFIFAFFCEDFMDIHRYTTVTVLESQKLLPKRRKVEAITVEIFHFQDTIEGGKSARICKHVARVKPPAETFAKFEAEKSSPFMRLSFLQMMVECRKLTVSRLQPTLQHKTVEKP